MERVWPTFWKVGGISLLIKQDSFSTRHDWRLWRTEAVRRRPSSEGGRKSLARCVLSFLAYRRRFVRISQLKLITELLITSAIESC